MHSKTRRVTGCSESAGVNRHVVGDARALRERASDSILTFSLAGHIVRWVHIASFNATAKVIKTGRGTSLSGPMEVPGGRWIINGQDPQKSIFSLVNSKTGGATGPRQTNCGILHRKHANQVLLESGQQLATLFLNSERAHNRRSFHRRGATAHHHSSASSPIIWAGLAR